MNHFLDLLDIDPKIDVRIILSPINENGDPVASVRINDNVLYQGPLSDILDKTLRVGLLDPIEIEIGLKDKNYSMDKETAIVIDQISIDKFDLIPDYTHLATYQNSHNEPGPTSYLGFNGVWKLSIPGPFYRWRHRVTGQGWLLEPVKNVVRGSTGTV